MWGLGYVLGLLLTYFQLHVMDSVVEKDRVVLKAGETVLLSTPCNGFVRPPVTC